ncbi:protein-disulfide reductase DsbD [Teredinibacter sp. KSP-S5-2]|uniref:protein-disulfide reductase DsbD family protein n=1 Tax=Teredinibacter sp. KSP-S5-2 TaxID=3034506 RepID=UPI0029352C3F|nr:protein-disulfide reductase DsbD [Teredinibacter sp. KSP-S5-2]WNO08559.1 protein-disulfide reductase DsbD [Teredinibacter sp. KSP-S5-2]
MKLPALSPQTVMKRFFSVFLIVCTVLALSNNALATKPLPPTDDATLDLFHVSEEPEFLRVDQAYQAKVTETPSGILVDWTIHPGYYLYQHQFKLVAQNGETSEEISFTSTPGKKKFDEYFGKELEVHYQNLLLTADVPQLTKPYEIVVRSQGCADAGLCYPPRNQYFKINTTGDFSEQDNASFALTEKKTTQNLNPTPTEEQPLLIVVLLGALLGGVILNLMPCVFPVLSLKALSFASSNLNESKQHIHGWAYTLGVVGSFMLAAAFILVARNAGQALGWGFQLQQPNFVAVMVYLFLIMGLSLSGLLNIGTRFMGAGDSLTAGHNYKASFFTGVLAALVASPCTAPFMATALGFALTQPAGISLTVFAALGFGMALPFLLLSYSPALARFLPKPGAWMDNLKQCLAFPLYLTSIWLLYVLGNQAGMYSAALLMAGGVALAFAAWLSNIPTSTTSRTLIKRIFILLSLAAAIMTMPFATVKDESHWQTYNEEKLETLRNQGTAVFVNLTADWCITCKMNERLAMTDDFKEKAKANSIILLKGDWTNPDPKITALLKRHGRNGVPLYLMYPAKANAEAEVLPQILTKSLLLEAMNRASQK